MLPDCVLKFSAERGHSADGRQDLCGDTSGLRIGLRLPGRSSSGDLQYSNIRNNNIFIISGPIYLNLNLKVLNQLDFLLFSFQINFAEKPNIPSVHRNMLVRLCNFCMYFMCEIVKKKLLRNKH